MKKKKLLCWLLPLLAVCIAVFTAAWMLSVRADQLHTARHARYRAALENAKKATLTVTERDETCGSFTLQELGLLSQAEETLSRQFSRTEQMNDADFSVLGLIGRVRWYLSKEPAGTGLYQADGSAADTGAVLDFLNAMPRTASEDAAASFVNARYICTPEVQGTELDDEAVDTLLRAAIGELCVTPERAPQVSVELTQTDCYRKPEILSDDETLSPDAVLARALGTLQIPVHFAPGGLEDEENGTQTLEAKMLLSVDAGGALQVSRDALLARCEAWAEQYSTGLTPYRFDSYVDGLREIYFLPVTYQLDSQALADALEAQLLSLQSGTVDAPFLCLDRSGEPFGLGDTYIEVDLDNQVMTMFNDGKLVATTDIVSGRALDRKTVTGLYHVENKETDCYLSGPDYLVWVQYWVGFYGAYGIHDANWRSEFGGELYLLDGSHGCINTPDEAMAAIHTAAEVGDPVLVYGYNTYYEPGQRDQAFMDEQQRLKYEYLYW